MNLDELLGTLGKAFDIIITFLWILLPFMVFIIKSRLESLQDSVGKLQGEEQKTQQWLSAIYDELHEMNTVLSPPEVPAKKNREAKGEGDDDAEDSRWAPSE